MSKWKTDDILAMWRKVVAERTAGWSDEHLREKLASVLAAVEPILVTLDGIVDNPDRGRHGGMTVTSGLFMERFGKEEDVPEPWGYRLEPGVKDWVAVPFKWSDPQPANLQTAEAEFSSGESLHPDTEILSVWQYATACSIFVGSFDASDVTNLVEACKIPRPANSEVEGAACGNNGDNCP